jgi:predicted transposase/invertase (TIGR01784 family)
MALTDKYINPFTDFGFKRLFGSEPNKDLLIDFLNQLLPAHHKIEDLTYADKEQLPLTEYERKAIFDIYCTNAKGEKFIVEIQKAKQNFFKDRSVYYSTFPIQRQAQAGEWDYQLKAVYTIGILDFVFDENKNNTDVVHFVQLKNQNCQVFYDKLTFIYLEMPKFQKTESELETDFDKWLYVFKNLHRLDNIPQRLQTKIFQKLFGEAELAKLKPTDIMAYEESLKVYRDLKAVTDTAYGDGYKEAAEKFGIEIVEERRQKEEAIKKKEEAIKKQEEAIKKQEEAIKKQEEAIKKQEEAIKLMVLNGISKETISATLGVSIDGIDQIMKS